MMKKLIISVSGIRGIYGESLVDRHAFDFGRAFGIWSAQENIVIGRDTRKSGILLKESFVRGLLEAGKNVYDAGIVPTPALTWFVEKHPNFCGAIITASHNPMEYNGIKLISSSGTFLNPEEFLEFLDVYGKQRNETFRQRKTGTYLKFKDFMEKFFSSLLDCVDADAIRKKNFKIVVDPVQGVGALYSQKFLEMLGCSVTMINEKPIGEFSHHPEPTPEHLECLSEAVRKKSACTGFAQDPDCDRLALVSENGSFISEEQGLALLIGWILKRNNGPVVVNISTTKLIDYICGKFHADLSRTKVGEVYVVERMKKIGAVAGGEGNGGIILPEFHYGRDSFAGMALTLEMMAKTESELSTMVSNLPDYFFIKKKFEFPVTKIEQLYRYVTEAFSSGTANYLDGLRIDFEDLWIGIRPSGTEPIIRVFVEGTNKEKVVTILNLIEHQITSCGKKN